MARILGSVFTYYNFQYRVLAIVCPGVYKVEARDLANPSMQDGIVHMSYRKIKELMR